MVTCADTAEEGVDSKAKIDAADAKLEAAVKKVAEAQGCDYVLEAMTLHYISPAALDLMPLVKKELGI